MQVKKNEIRNASKIILAIKMKNERKER